MAPVRASNRVVRILLAGITLMLVSACATEFDREFGEAERLRAEAAAAGAEWLETGNLLEQAREAEAAGNTARARELVEEAKFQAEAALRQAGHEAEAWRERVIR